MTDARADDELTPDLIDEGVLTETDLYENPSGSGTPPQLFDSEEPLEPDTEPAMVAEESAEPSARVSPEEGAMRIVDEPPGASYDEDPGYLD